MSDQGESDTARLARESERTALAKAAAELEAEREAMRAEFAAIEEEERLEAERVKQLAKATQTKTTGSLDRFFVYSSLYTTLSHKHTNANTFSAFYSMEIQPMCCTTWY